MNSETPKTDAAREAYNQGEFAGSEPDSRDIYAIDMESLERQHNALISKLEALAKEWKAIRPNQWEHYSPQGHCGLAIEELIREAKQ